MSVFDTNLFILDFYLVYLDLKQNNFIANLTLVFWWFTEPQNHLNTSFIFVHVWMWTCTWSCGCHSNWLAEAHHCYLPWDAQATPQLSVQPSFCAGFNSTADVIINELDTNTHKRFKLFIRVNCLHTLGTVRVLTAAVIFVMLINMGGKQSSQWGRSWGTSL